MISKIKNVWGRPDKLGALLLVCAAIGFGASFVLTIDKIKILQDPSFVPSCNINPIFSCGSVMATEQASLLGVPNTIFGLIAFTMLGMLGLFLLAGARLPRWLWLLVQLAALGGLLFMHYLFFQGVYRIGAICPWCFTVWMVTIPAFLYITRYNLVSGNLRLSWQMSRQMRAAGTWFAGHAGLVLILWYLMIFGILLQHFWYYWSTLL